MAEKLTLKKILALTVSIISALILFSCGTAEEEYLITDYNELRSALLEAEDGSTILVGDIDFSPTSPDIPNSFMNIELDRGVTIKSGKRDGAAVFTNGSFLLTGSKSSGSGTAYRFENIIFDGGADHESMTLADFDYPWNEAVGEYTHYVPMDAQQALSFKGNVDAVFENCVFKNYMHEYGPVIDIRYADYTDNEYLSAIFADYSGCTLNLIFNSCTVENNSCLYDGGAIYIESNKNVFLSAENCVFSSNRAGNNEFSRGGGFLFASGADISLKNCKLDKNQGNYTYDGAALPEYDTHRGGAMYLEGSKLKLVNSSLSENTASMGGALTLTNTVADIDGCSFTENRAEWNASNPYESYGPWSNMGQGGAVYVEGNNEATVNIVNCEIKDNSAKEAYGGLYVYYTPNEDPALGVCHVKMQLSSYENNTCDTKYDYTVTDIYPWASHQGDMFANPHLTAFGCYVVDETFGTDFPHDEKPSSENGYNYLSVSPSEDILSSEIPTDEVKNAVGSRYGDKLKKVHVGNNYSEKLYKEEAEESSSAWFIAVGTVLIIIGISVVIFSRKKPALIELPTDEAPAPEIPQKIVMLRYEDSEIDRFISLSAEARTLTGRETEVLREILRGKKQSEVAYYLGIEVSTVKDFYKKIYTKLNVPNKDGLLKKVSEVLEK